MGEIARTPVPYTDEFRKARRNSLLWSSLTIAASFGTSNSHDGLVTSQSVGLNLGFDQGVIVGLFGLVAIFMAVGFVQAYNQLRLYASNLFAGNTDVEETFATLSRTASEIRERLKEFDSRHQTLMREIDRPFTRMAEILGALIPIDYSFAHNIDLDDVHIDQRSPSDIKIAVTNADQMKKRVKQWARQAENRLNGIKQRVQESTSELNQEMHKALNSRDVFLTPFLESEKAALDGDLLTLQAKVTELRRFHDGIYRSDRLWFYLWDVTPTAALFLVSLIATTRVLFSN